MAKALDLCLLRVRKETLEEVRQGPSLCLTLIPREEPLDNRSQGLDLVPRVLLYLLLCGLGQVVQPC